MDEWIMLTGRGRTQTELEPLLELDDMDACLMRSMTGAETALGQGAEGVPVVMVWPLEPLCELGGPRMSSDRRFGRARPFSKRASSATSGESGGEPNGAIAFGTRAVLCELPLSEVIGSGCNIGALVGPPFCGDARDGFLGGTERGAMGDVCSSSGAA